MRQTHCAICKNKEELHTLYPATFRVKKITQQTFSARRSPDRMHYQFVQCKRCGLIFSNPIFSTQTIANLYKKSTFEYTKESVFLQKTYGDLLEKVLSKKTNAKQTLLDIGCGNGFLLEEAIQRGIQNVYGVEPGKASVNKASRMVKDRIIVDIFKAGLYKKNFFDVITCFHTLDHIVDPNIFLQTVYANLKKGGKALFVVHDTQGLSVRLFGEKSPIFDIEHIYLFNKSTLKKLFAQNKFGKIQILNVKNTYPLSYWLRMTPAPMVIKKMLLDGLKYIRLGSVPISVSAGNIAIIAEKI